jgi:hypothetical protein
MLSPIRDWYQNKNDKFGFYEVGTYKTYSKLDAIETSRRLNIPVKWNFNEPIFSSYDWSIDPQQSLKEMYKARAQQLRDEYDHIALFFSGGADSTTALQAFVQNGIKLDEVVIQVQEDGALKNPDSWFNSELTFAAFPLLEKLKPLMRDTVITKINVIPTVLATAKNKSIDLPYEMNTLFSPAVAGRPQPRKLNPKWDKLSAQGKKVVFLWGHQKPLISNNSGKYNYSITDQMDFCVSPKQQMVDDPTDYNELFFSSPDCVPLIIKQAHTVKKYLESTTTEHQLGSFYEAGQITANFGSVVINKIKYNLKVAKLNQLIYPADWWDPLTFSRGKPTSFIYSEGGNWLLNSNTDEGNFYKKQVDAVRSLLGNEWYQSKEAGVECVKPISSPLYYLGSQKT